MEELSTNIIREKIYIIRSRKVMFDSDLAMLYEVPTHRLNEAVKRNIKRFPEDFMFKLNKKEADMFLISQIAISSNRETHSRSQFATLNETLENKDQKDILKSQIETSRWGGSRKGTHVFTEQGIAMLSSVLKSDKAISVNIQIIRIFTKLREMIDTYKELREKVEEMERSNTKTFHQIFDIIKSIIQEKDKPGNPIGFTVDGD